MMPRKGLTEARAKRAREREEQRNRAVKMREDGYFVTEIAEAVGVVKSTAYEWTKHVKVAPEVEQAREERRRSESTKNLYVGRMDEPDHVRRNNYQRGRDSELTAEDLYCIGQYGGEGQKAQKNGIWSPTWKVVNADLEFMRRMIGYAIRAGQEPLQFRATIYVHEGVAVSDEDVQNYWAAAGIPVDRIGIYKIENDQTGKEPRHILSWGTCHLEPIENGVPLFWYWCGQYDQFLEQAGRHPVFQSLLDELCEQDVKHKNERLSQMAHSTDTSTT